MNPEYFDYISSCLFESGALDVYYIPLQMKKNRPGVQLNVLCSENKRQELVDIILKETTTLGLRVFSDIERYCLERRHDVVQTEWGKIKVKIGLKEGEVINVAPEYEDCRQIAEEKDLPLKVVYRQVNNKWWQEYN